MIPKAIFEQFRRLSNFYFLIVAAISFIPNISPSSPITTTLPLLVVIGFGLARDVYEDLLRKRADAEANNRPVIIRNRLPANTATTDSRPRTAVPVPSASADEFLTAYPDLEADDYTIIRSVDIAVGDVVVVKDDMSIPADLVVLSSANTSGECFVSTANLDGESNLKRRQAPAVTNGSPSDSSDAALSAIVTISAPTPSLYEIEGSMRRKPDAPPTPIDDRHVLLRGSILRNTPFVHAVVVYTGRDTKIALNMRDAPSKLGGIERMMNRIVVSLFGLLLALTVVTATLAGVWQRRYGLGQWYMDENRLLSGRTVALRSLGTFIILYHTFVPVSLFVTLEFVRLVQGWFITNDKYMHSRKGHADVKANNLNECLGYVDHIFTDKTGTLTKNEMRFVATITPDGHTTSFPGKAESLKEDVLDGNSPQFSHLLQVIALAHDVAPVCKKSRRDGEEHLEYQGESVDEIALLNGSREVGVSLIERSTEGNMVIESARGERSDYKLLAILEFSSERKRMSVVIRNQDGEIWVFSKGADSVMFPLLSNTSTVNEGLATIRSGMDEMSKNGLRTLIYAQRRINEEDFEVWIKKYEEAANAMVDRVGQKESVAKEIECELECIGVTGVEDQLQDEVGSCIVFFRMAGMRIWVVTGDKVETAENIGYSTMLLNDHMSVLKLTKCESEANLEASLQKLEKNDNGDKDIGLIIDGDALNLVEMSSNRNLEAELVEVAMRCKSVICARVTPLQKAYVVKIVQRYHKNVNTLAIGDGGNDVSMIQESNIGIGIKGKEGSQAARAADYSIMEFKHLVRLLAIHGRYSYLRTAGVINLSFYKNVFFSCTQFLFQWFCFASGTTVHNQWIVTAWNSILTLFPPFFYGIFERDLDELTLLKFPFAYDSNRRNRLFNLATVVEYTIGYSTWHAFVLFWLMFFVMGSTERIAFASSGHDAGFYLIGLGISYMALCIALFKFLLVSHLWTACVICGIAFSFAMLWGLVALFPSLFHELALEGVLSKLMSSSTFHLLWPLVFVTAFLPDFVVRFIRSCRHNLVETLQLYEFRQS